MPGTDALTRARHLLAANPQLMQPLRLILPHDAAQRPFGLLRAGLVTEVCRMIMPGKTRYMGIPLAMMPQYLKLV